MLSLSISISSLALVAALPQGGGMVINEFSYDDSGTDDHEFVELCNGGDAPVDISGWVLESRDTFGANSAFTIDPGTVLQPGDFWVLGSANVPNVDQVVGTTNIWENDAESLTLYDLTPAVVDTLIYEANKGVFDATLAEGEGVWGNFTSIAGLETSWSRLADGHDTDDNGRDFRVIDWSPGTSNDQAGAAPWLEDFDAQLAGAAAAGWGGSFVKPAIIDPTVADAFNPSAISASPQGGNALIAWDPAGGGNSGMLLVAPTQGAVFEAWVYFDAALRPAGQREVWTIGFGTTGTFFNSPDPNGTFGFTANGNTGVNWTYEVTDVAATLTLMDNNNGGWGTAALSQPTVLGQITLTAGVDDGWQRLRLQVGGGMAEGRFGGSYGGNDGQTIAGATDDAYAGFYVGYRETVSPGTAGARPITIDAFRLEPADSNLSVIGDGTSGTHLRFELSGAPAHALSVVLLSPMRISMTLDLGLFGDLYLGVGHPLIPLPLGITDRDGNASRTVPVWSHSQQGWTLYGQAVSLDLNLSLPSQGHDSRGGRPSFPIPRPRLVGSDTECFKYGVPPTN